MEFWECRWKAATMGNSSVRSEIGTMRRVPGTLSATCAGITETPIPPATNIMRECFDLTCKLGWRRIPRVSQIRSRNRQYSLKSFLSRPTKGRSKSSRKRLGTGDVQAPSGGINPTNFSVTRVNVSTPEKNGLSGKSWLQTATSSSPRSSRCSCSGPGKSFAPSTLESPFSIRPISMDLLLMRN